MPTNKIVVRTTEEFMSGYKPNYKPLYAILLGRAQAYAEEVGKVNFNRLSAVGDLRSKHYTPKDTEMRQISVASSAKSFKKYFMANQYVQSTLQRAEDIDSIVAQVLDEHQKQMDDLVLLGEGTAGNNVINNGLYWSGDANYTLESSEEMANAPDTQAEMYDLLQANLADARDLSGRKAIVVYGETALAKLSSLFPEKDYSLSKVLRDNLEEDEQIIRMPSAVTPASANGWIIVNLDQVKLHYVTLPKLADQGTNTEKMYSWHNFLMGSAMVEVEAPNGVIRQPVTFEA